MALPGGCDTVIVIWIAIFFVLMSVAAWLTLFPAPRERAWAVICSVLRRFSSIADRAGDRASTRIIDSGRNVRDSSTRVASTVKRHRLVLLISILLIAGPPIVILMTRQTVVLDGFSDDDTAPTNPLIAELLRGERLIPPQPLPPEVFVVAEIERKSAGMAVEAIEIVTADRKWDRLDTDLQQRVLAVFKVMREQYGYDMVLTEGYRSPERQAGLPKSVTRAGPWQSCHQFGLAADSAVFRNGKLQWDLGDAWVRRGYMLYGQLARQAGLEWGGDWRSFKDLPHVERSALCAAAKRARRNGA